MFDLLDSALSMIGSFGNKSEVWLEMATSYELIQINYA